jgi:hypothetical protein
VACWKKRRRIRSRGRGLQATLSSKARRPLPIRVIADMRAAGAGRGGGNLARAFDALERDAQLIVAGRFGELLDGVAGSDRGCGSPCRP